MSSKGDGITIPLKKMFHHFIKNKILTGLLLLSSFSYGGSVCADNNPSEASEKQTHHIAQNDYIDVNGMRFYIPPEEPSREEQKAKAVLMYWERKDPVTGQILVTKYPDTLKVKEEVRPEHYTKVDLELLLGPDRARFYPEYHQLQNKKEMPVIKQPSTEILNATNKMPVVSDVLPATNKVVVVQNKSKDSLDEILERLDAEEKHASQTLAETAEQKLMKMLNLTDPIQPAGQKDVQELLDLLDKEEVDATNNVPVTVPAVSVPETISTGLPGADMVQKALDELAELEVEHLENIPEKNVENDAQEAVATNHINQSAASSAQQVEELLRLLEEEESKVPHPEKGNEKKSKEAESETPNLVYKKPDLFPDQEKRDVIAERLHAIRAMEDIKEQRRILTKQMRQAKKNQDNVKIKEISEKRKSLTQKRREKCFCLLNPQMAVIKEKRRLLTKKMTIARRQQDVQMMNTIAAERLVLKNQVKALNAVVRDFDYKKNRQRFLKMGTVALIHSHRVKLR